MNGSILAAGSGFPAPSIDAFNPPVLWDFHLLGVDFAFTRITIINWIAIVAVCGLFMAAVRSPKLVPDKMQWLGESAYGFIRDGVAREVIGPEGLRFARYLAALFFFIFANNVMGIVPLAQIAPTSKFAIPLFMAIISWLLFNWVGIRRHGFAGYFKGILFPPGVPKPLYILITPIEFFSTLIVRPFTLAVRLFANMFAGHLLLLVFTLGTTYLLTVGNFSVIFSPVSFVVALLMTLFEFVVEALQAYVFTILTAVYIAGAVEEEH